MDDIIDYDELVKGLPNKIDFIRYKNIYEKKDEYAYVYRKFMKRISKLIVHGFVSCVSYSFTKDKASCNFKIPTLEKEYEIAKEIGTRLNFKYCHFYLYKDGKYNKSININEIQKKDIKNLYLIFCDYEID